MGYFLFFILIYFFADHRANYIVGVNHPAGIAYFFCAGKVSGFFNITDCFPVLIEGIECFSGFAFLTEGAKSITAYQNGKNKNTRQTHG